MTTKVQNPMRSVYDRLSQAGVSRSYVRKVILPEWWDDQAALSEAGFLEGLGIISRHLGVSLSSLRQKGRLTFRPRHTVRFKKTGGVADRKLVAAQTIATQALWLTGYQTRTPFQGVPHSAAEIRQQIILKSKEPVNLKNLLAYCWDNGIVVLHVANFPPGARKMDALATLHNGRPGIVLCKNLQSASWMVFHLAHELGHVAHRHMKPEGVLVDTKVDPRSRDKEEREANRFAVELLTGSPDLQFVADSWLNAAELAKAAKAVGRRVKVDPGVVALNYAWQDKLFAVANLALQQIESSASAVQMVHEHMLRGLSWVDIPESNREYLQKLTGTNHGA